jgi:TPR repeat protein
LSDDGNFAFLGIGYCIDLSGAEELLKLAARQGHAEDQFNYALARLRDIESGEA